jgi:hypothetical protein
MRISVTADLADLKRNLTRTEKDQVPFATSVALNNVAADVANAITAQMERYLENPTPFTLKAYQSRTGTFKGTRSTKKRLWVDLIPGKIQAEYLRFQIAGGTRTPNQKAIFVPTRLAPKNKYGNVPKGTRRRIISGKGSYFVAGQREQKTPGVYKRVGDKLEPMAFFVDKAEYKPIFPIDKISQGVTRNRFRQRFREALKRAMRSAR